MSTNFLGLLLAEPGSRLAQPAVCIGNHSRQMDRLAVTAKKCPFLPSLDSVTFTLKDVFSSSFD